MFAQITNINFVRLIISIIGIFYFFPLNARESNPALMHEKVEFEHIGESQGVKKVILCIYLDSKGFIWFGTAIDGLYKYNGYEFEQYQHIYDDSTSLMGNEIMEIFHEDSSGDIWIFAGRQLHRYNRSYNSFTQFLHNPDDPNSITDGIISSIC